jgi:hypothetical protein
MGEFHRERERKEGGTEREGLWLTVTEYGLPFPAVILYITVLLLDTRCVRVYYCSTYYKAVRVGGGG